MRKVVMHVKLKDTKYTDYFGHRQKIKFETKFIKEVYIKNMDGTTPTICIEGSKRSFFFNYEEGFKIKIICPACNRKPTLETIVKRVFGDDMIKHLSVSFIDDVYLDDEEVKVLKKSKYL